MTPKPPPTKHNSAQHTTTTMKLHTVTSLGEFDKVLKSELVIVDFFAEWCGPCKVISPFVETLQSDYNQVLFAKVDVDQGKDIAAKYTVSSMPTFVYFHKGKEVNRVVGADRAGITTGLDQLVSLNPAAVKSLPGAGGADSEDAGSTVNSADNSAIAAFVPKNMEILNSGIDFTSTEALNIANNGDVRNVLTNGLSGDQEFVSDTDSQMLLNVQLQNNAKIQTILLKKPAVSGDNQIPSHIKVWANHPNLSFDDTQSIEAQHVGDVVFDGEWAEIKLRYVRFQNVSTISMLIEGEDEDECTNLDRVVLIGSSGEARSGKLEKMQD
ncbi:YALI0E31647p [Yarrowia lipolytica CLIB122]|jgi:thioredoxin|uniref:YALI0E31647p n=2 Tax=Yarrowia lipolytica TaxID=4952 RepID=Q6C3W5_YARLI|nr:YALI0E31647p [Yarrowia lipolytica CLIB122]CAG80251.1 YALI0E31647p [Yarrowia lipolytica CLIB122]SEI31861.1 YALIA101S02e03796g1_1 [Yarrowia lipolytica]VBB77546.1 Thioredoxin, putative [Yarrowia lipolytica]|eukprot:XP_504647.1 YALI0E31647p [Yarrowia lipolytica CLIB122]